MAIDEMHLIAYVYHWSRDTLFSLSLSERRIWVDKILAQKDAENKQ